MKKFVVIAIILLTAVTGYYGYSFDSRSVSDESAGFYSPAGDECGRETKERHKEINEATKNESAENANAAREDLVETLERCNERN